MQKILFVLLATISLATWAQPTPPAPPAPPTAPMVPPPPPPPPPMMDGSERYEHKIIIKKDGKITEIDGRTGEIHEHELDDDDGDEIIIIERDGKKTIINKEENTIIEELNENGKKTIIRRQIDGSGEHMELDMAPWDPMELDTTRLKVGGIDIIIKDLDRDGMEDDIDDEIRREIEREMGRMRRHHDHDDDDDDDDYDEDEDDDEDNDGDRKDKKLSNVKTRWGMLDLGINTYLQDGGFDFTGDAELMDLNYARSINVNIHVFRQRVNLIAHHVNLLYGLSFDLHNYSFSEPITLQPDTEPLVITMDSENDLRRNRLYNSFVEVPVMINLTSNPRKPGKAFRVSAGGYAGFLLGSRTRQRQEEGGQTVIQRDDFNLNKFRYGLTGQVGIGPINFYANYALNPLFEDGKGPELHPLNIGISVIPF